MKDINKRPINRILKNFINVNTTGDFYVHGFVAQDKNEFKTKCDSIFSNGLQLQQNASILSTLKLLHENQEIEDLNNYVARGNCRVLVHIPEIVGDFYLGRCLKKYNDVGNQYCKNHILDTMRLTNIPTEFIVGVILGQDETRIKFIKNPYYYKVSKGNTKILISKLKEKVKNHIVFDEDIFKVDKFNYEKLNKIHKMLSEFTKDYYDETEDIYCNYLQGLMSLYAKVATIDVKN